MAGLALGAILTSSIEKSVIDHSKNETAQFVAAEVDRVFPGMDFSLPMTGPRYEDFQRRVPHLLFNPSIKRIKVLNPDSVIVWSDERQLVGKQFLDDKELLKALNGTVSSKIISPDNKPETRTESQYSRLLELYIPIRSEHERKVKAVLEIYQDLEYLDADTSRQKRILWISIVAGFSGIYFACFGIVWRASRRLSEQTLEVEKSEERNRDLVRELTSMINNVPGIVYRGYRDWSLSFIGAEVEPITGYPPDKFTSGAVGWKEIIHPDDMEQVKEAFRKADKEKSDTLHVEYRIRHRDGGIRWIADRRQLIYLESGGFAYVDGLLLDITEGKKVEDNLRESEDRYRDLVEHSQDLICTHDLKGRLLSVNPWAARDLGYSQNELLRMNMRDLIAPEVRDEFDGYLEEIGKHGAARGILLVQTRNGERRVWEYNNTLRTKDVTEPVVRGMAQDVTERKRAEKALRESERRYRGLFGHMQEGFAYCKMIFENGDPVDFIYLSVNEAFETLTGLKSVEGKRVSEVIPGIRASDPSLFETYGRVACTGNPEKIEIFVEALQQWFSISVYSPEQGYFVTVFGVITDRKRAEIEKEKLQAQLRQAIKMEAVGRLAGGIAHDFNNLLTAIIGNVSMAQAKLSPPDPVAGVLMEANKAADRAAALTQQLLAFSRKQIIEPKVLNLNDLIADLNAMLVRLIREDIKIQISPGEDLGSVKVDAGQFQQVLVNLVVNARDAMPGGGEIVIETSNAELDDGYCSGHPYVKPGRFVMVAVSDMGHGMSEEVKAHIFEPFFTTKAKGSGTGLGLATTYGVVKQAGGSIEVYSEVGMGTTFKIYLPRDEGEASKLVRDDRPQELLGGTETVLLVEDEDIVRDMCVRVLDELGYKVLQASNGKEAIALSKGRGGRIDLLMTDVVMPGMNGSELATQLILHRPEMRVLFTSGYTENVIVHHGVLDDAVSFLGKPYSPSTLAKKIRQVLDKVG
jgi:PAS domain S-box-containing protein